MTVNYRTGDSQARPWGTWEVLDTGDQYALKKLVIHPGKGISLQVHEHRDEHWVVVSGTGQLRLNNTERQVCTNEHVFIHTGDVHQITNDGLTDLVLIEVQWGQLLDETDINRINI